jgi:hypothetical protein
MRTIKSLTLALAAVFAVGVAAVPSASATGPLFLNEGGAAKASLLFTAISGTAVLRAKKLTQEFEINCEESSTHGFTLNKTSLADEVDIEFKTNCNETAPALGLNKAACVEPIKVKETRGELGLTTLGAETKLLALLLAPVSGSEFVTTECAGVKTVVGGAIVGFLPQRAKYNKFESEAELVFRASGAKQEPTEIELLGVNMTGVTLALVEAFGEEASEATKASVKGDGKVAIDTD